MRPRSSAALTLLLGTTSVTATCAFLAPVVVVVVVVDVDGGAAAAARGGGGGEGVVRFVPSSSSSTSSWSSSWSSSSMKTTARNVIHHRMTTNDDHDDEDHWKDDFDPSDYGGGVAVANDDDNAVGRRDDGRGLVGGRGGGDERRRRGTVGGRGGRGRGGRRGGRGGGRGPSSHDRLGPNGHDYAVTRDAFGINNSRYADSDVHSMLAERLRAKFARDFRTADSIQNALIAGGVYVHDGLREWRADGIPYEGPSFRGGVGGGGGGRGGGGGGGGGGPSRYARSSHSPDVDPTHGASDELIDRLVNERTKFKAMRQYDKADAVREGLRTKFNVLIDDRLMEWSVGGDFGEENNLKREMASSLSERGYIKSKSSLDLDDDETEEYVQHHVDARAIAKRDRNFDGADKIRLDLAQRFDVTINDKLKLWSVGGVFEEMPGGGVNKVGKPRGVYVRRGGGDISSEDEDAISRMLTDRHHAKKQRNYDAADEIRDVLMSKYNVRIDDRSNEWRVDTNDYAQRRSSSLSSASSGEDDDNVNDGVPILSEEVVKYVDSKLRERFDLKRARSYEDADAIRDELMDKYGVQIDDRTKEWFVVEGALSSM